MHDQRREGRWIVVGVDGSSAAEGAVRWAALLAPLLHADVAVVHALGLVGRLDGELVPAHAHRDEISAVVSREWCAPLVEAGVRHRVRLREQAAVDAVLAEIDELQPILVVVGTRGTGMTSAQSIGSTALRLLREATAPVIVVPDAPHRVPGALRRILLGVDGTAPALAAVDWSAELARRTGASCEVLTAGAWSSDAVTTRHLGHEIEAWSTPFRWAQVPLRTTVCGGDPAEELVRRAHEIDADLVVLGASGRGPAGDPLAGSVSRRVAREAGCAVAVVREGARLTRALGPVEPAAPVGG
ncbi:MAG: universal stress protein [Acidimicrobiales bacterium]|nr:universal stress protein [Acidimicrobiales bacterium]